MKVKVILRDGNIPSRRESEIVEDDEWEGGGYAEFECDDNKADTRQLSIGYMESKPKHYEFDQSE